MRRHGLRNHLVNVHISLEKCEKLRNISKMSTTDFH